MFFDENERKEVKSSTFGCILAVDAREMRASKRVLTGHWFCQGGRGKILSKNSVYTGAE
jgi:hypothetical protein